MNGNQQAIFALISHLGAGKNNIVVNPILCRLMGSIEGGVFLSQLLYWSDKGNGDWFYKTYTEWTDETTLSKHLVNRYATKCEELGFLERSVRKAKGNPTVHYRLDADKLSVVLIGKLTALTNQSEPRELTKVDRVDEPYTEITTENTTHIGVAPLSPPSPSSPSLRSGDSVVPPVARTQDFLEAYVAELGYEPASYGREAKAAKEMHRRGYTIADMIAAYRALKQQAFWASKHLSLQTVLQELPALADYAKKGGNINGAGTSTQQAFLNVERMLREQGLWNKE